MKYRLTNFLFLFIALLLYNSCKKYPENTLWFKKPGKILAKNYSSPWILEHYSVNDIDSTSANFVSVFKEEGTYIFSGNKNTNGFKCPGILEGTIGFSSNKKTLTFHYALSSFYTDSTINSKYKNQRNIFLNPELSWKIEKLCKDQFWISATFNSIKYEIHFK